MTLSHGQRLPVASSGEGGPDAALTGAWFAAFLRHTPAGAAVRDPVGRHVWVNPPFLQVLGVERSRVIGRTWAEFQPAGPANLISDQDERVLTSQAPITWRVPLHRVGAEVGELSGFSFPVELQHGRPGVGTTFVDLTGLKRMRERLAVSEQRYRGLFDWSEAPTAMFGMDQLVRDANPAYCRLLGYRRDEIRGMHVRKLINRATALLSSDRWLAVVRGELQGYTTLSTGVRKDGSTVTGQTIISLVRDAAGRPDLICAVSPPAILAGDGPAVGLSDTPPLELSEREIAVLEGVALGQSSAQLARQLSVSQKGVDYHVAKLAELLGVPNRTALIARAYATGLLVPGLWPPRATAYVAEWRRRPPP